jgi:regulation of enolase protein 1 (concanavalin A-like superfamily)
MQWDEFGDGCMHKAASRNREPSADASIWIRLVRHGDSFSGYFSDDGQTWTRATRTGSMPGLADAVDIGLAAGGPDQRVYEVQFENFTLDVETAARMATD